MLSDASIMFIPIYLNAIDTQSPDGGLTSLLRYLVDKSRGGLDDLSPPQVLQLCGMEGKLFDEEKTNLCIVVDPMALMDRAIYKIISKPKILYRAERIADGTFKKQVSFMHQPIKPILNKGASETKTKSIIKKSKIAQASKKKKSSKQRLDQKKTLNLITKSEFVGQKDPPNVPSVMQVTSPKESTKHNYVPEVK